MKLYMLWKRDLIYFIVQHNFGFFSANLLFDIAFPAVDLWNQFRDALCADCRRAPTQPINYDTGLQLIEHTVYQYQEGEIFYPLVYQYIIDLQPN